MWKYVLAALGVLIGIIAIFLAIAQDQSTLRVESPYGAADRAFPPFAAALTGAAITTGNRFEVLVDGGRIFPRMLAAIGGARERISLETYIYTPGQIASRFDAALERAARRGVRVNLVFDALGSPDVETETLPRLQAAGARIALFNKPAWYTLEELNYRTHRKILVVDGRIGFTGGVGMSDNWVGRPEDGQGWRDTQFEITGPAVRFLEGGFSENFVEGADRPVTPEIGNPLPEAGTSDQTLVVWSSPTGGGNALKELYLLSIAAARRSLDIASPYFLLDESTTWALHRAIDRGVKIRVLVEGDVTDAKPVKYASRYDYERLLQKGIEIHEYQPTLMHSKTVVVDGAWSMFGSANFDNRSLELNDELNVATQETDLAARITAQFEEDLRRARRLELDQWRRRSRLEKLREWVWSHFGEVF
ncbi:MAG TPA: phospholipase D-like domain-containing protein [Vicinamibacterales bacterium]|nr:phospholipase D-like domain-containing protein [Vicinamibacterales bacterium]